VRASLPKHNTWLRLGMTATARLDGAVNAISIPLAAVFSSQSEPDIAKVWLIDESSHQVTAVAVGLGQIQAGERVLVSGLKNGQLLVSAGAQRLLPGQSVKILTEPELKLHKDSNS
jgi:multidrug efflux pump subunit AcrA (membrane-fusion protein)